MKSYITTETVTVYTCGLCKNSWDSRRKGWDKPENLASDAPEPDADVLEQAKQEIYAALPGRKTQPNKKDLEAEVRSQAITLAGDKAHGKDECPFCGGSA